MKDALKIALIVLLMIISVIILTAVVTGYISVFAIICPILILILFPWFIVFRHSRSKNPSHPEEIAQGKLSLDAVNRITDKRLKDGFKFVILPCLILVILLIILLIAVKYTS